MSTRAPEKPKPPTPRPPIDPRIRARRIEVQRTEGRRRLQRLGMLGIVVATVAGLLWLTLTPLLDVDHIRVRGATHSGTPSVLAAIGIRRGDALLTADVGRAAGALSTLPWIATAKVRRSWPGTVVVTVVERTPIAAVEASSGGWVLLDVGGRQLTKEKEPALDIVRVAGRAMVVRLGHPAARRYRGALDLAAAIPRSLRGSVASLWPQRDGSLEATIALPGRDAPTQRGATATARFGAPTQLAAKLVALAAVLERADLANIRVIDLRVPGAPALTRA